MTSKVCTDTVIAGPTTARPCAGCKQMHNPYKMYFCAICHILYCNPACAVTHWPRHRARCVVDCDAVFIDDVAYALRCAQLTTCVSCATRGCSVGCPAPTIDPRIAALGLDPVVVTWPCWRGGRVTDRDALAAEIMQRIQANALEIASHRNRVDFELFPQLNSELYEQLTAGKVANDHKSLCRLWTACRIATWILFRKSTQEKPWVDIEPLLRNSLHTWCSIGRALTALSGARPAALTAPPGARPAALVPSLALAAQRRGERAAAMARAPRRAQWPAIATAPIADLHLAFQALQTVIDAHWAE